MAFLLNNCHVTTAHLPDLSRSAIYLRSLYSRLSNPKCSVNPWGLGFVKGNHITCYTEEEFVVGKSEPCSRTLPKIDDLPTCKILFFLLLFLFGNVDNSFYTLSLLAKSE